MNFCYLHPNCVCTVMVLIWRCSIFVICLFAMYVLHVYLFYLVSVYSTYYLIVLNNRPWCIFTPYGRLSALIFSAPKSARIYFASCYTASVSDQTIHNKLYKHEEYETYRFHQIQQKSSFTSLQMYEVPRTLIFKINRKLLWWPTKVCSLFHKNILDSGLFQY